MSIFNTLHTALAVASEEGAIDREQATLASLYLDSLEATL